MGGPSIRNRTTAKGWISMEIATPVPDEWIDIDELTIIDSALI